MLVLFVGLLLGLVFFLGGLSGAATRFRRAFQALRFRRSGVRLDAEILARRAAERRPTKDQVVTGQWVWGERNYRDEFTVPETWLAERGGTLTMPVRIDPDRPHRAVVEDDPSSSPFLDLVVALVWVAMAAVGVLFLVAAWPAACSQPDFDELLQPICDAL